MESIKDLGFENQDKEPTIGQPFEIPDVTLSMKSREHITFPPPRFSPEIHIAKKEDHFISQNNNVFLTFPIKQLLETNLSLHEIQLVYRVTKNPHGPISHEDTIVKEIYRQGTDGMYLYKKFGGSYVAPKEATYEFPEENE